MREWLRRGEKLHHTEMVAREHRIADHNQAVLSSVFLANNIASRAPHQAEKKMTLRTLGLFSASLSCLSLQAVPFELPTRLIPFHCSQTLEESNLFPKKPSQQFHCPTNALTHHSPGLISLLLPPWLHTASNSHQSSSRLYLPLAMRAEHRCRGHR